MAQLHEWMFYETMWRSWAQGKSYPYPWWVQQYFRNWSDSFDSGLFESKEAAFSSNANYRYWNMIGVKDRFQEVLVGQTGEIEPVYDKYSLIFFLFDKSKKQLHFPNFSSGNNNSLNQTMKNNYIPEIITNYNSSINVNIEASAFASVTSIDNKTTAVVKYKITNKDNLKDIVFFVAVMPTGPTGFQRHDKAGRYAGDRRVINLVIDNSNKYVSVNSFSGPVFKTAAKYVGIYGNGNSYDPNHYIINNPFENLSSTGLLNNEKNAVDQIAGLCCGAFGWDVIGSEFELEVKLPIDDFRGTDELKSLDNEDGKKLQMSNYNFWEKKLNTNGIKFELPSKVKHVENLFKMCRANLLILADEGQIHPGPTIYDDFWIRDSAIEGIAISLSGDFNLAQTQFGKHYPNKFNFNGEQIGPVNTYGFFGGSHEKMDREWDSNGEALWAIGNFDRINGSSSGFGLSMYYPYMLEGARWLNRNRSYYGLLHDGWSAEHIGDKNKPHYWDDLWGIAGLYETCKLAERINANEIGELWNIYNSLKNATTQSIRWVLSEQRRYGNWETYIPTGPADVGRLDSTMIGLLAYFHPCKLYIGNKLGDDIDYAARMTLETIWGHFIDNGGFRHDSAWNCYGPYLTLQLAHAFLAIGDTEKMNICLNWSIENAGFAKVSRNDSGEFWQVVQGAWNEQHCYPISKNFAEFPSYSWYMGDIPHGWACAEYMMLVRDMLFFEADIDNNPHIYIAPGLLQDWIKNSSILVKDAPTKFGNPFGYKLNHNESNKEIEIKITQKPSENISYYYPCQFKNIKKIKFDGTEVAVNNNSTIKIPSDVNSIIINYI